MSASWHCLWRCYHWTWNYPNLCWQNIFTEAQCNILIKNVANLNVAHQCCRSWKHSCSINNSPVKVRRKLLVIEIRITFIWDTRRHIVDFLHQSYTSVGSKNNTCDHPQQTRTRHCHKSFEIGFGWKNETVSRTRTLPPRFLVSRELLGFLKQCWQQISVKILH